MKSLAWTWWLGLGLLVIACGRTHVVPPYPIPDGATMDSATDADPDGASDSADNDASHEERPARLPRNIILFMGDGMGAEQLATGRVAAGGRLRLDALAGPVLANTDSLTSIRVGGDDPPPTDSAAAATVIATGVLVENYVVSQDANGAPLETVLELCKRAGKATGLVTTSMFYDASPAAFASHQSARGKYAEIVRDMLTVSQPEVIMGSGAWVFDAPQDMQHEAAELAGYTVVRGVMELAAWDPLRQPRILGLFETNFRSAQPGEGFLFTPALERTADAPDPTQATMTERALERLSQDPDGFFLFSEDETFDIIGHRGTGDLAWANRAYPLQAMAFDAAVAVAIDWVLAHSSFDETLIVVLADHETGGYHFDHAVGASSGSFSRPGVHTRTPIEVYALGPGSDSLDQVKSHADTHRLLIGTLP